MRSAMRGAPAAVHERDAYELWLAMLPTRTGRGVVVVDPPYEQTDERARITATLAAPAAHAQATAGKAAVNDTLFATAAALGGLAEVSLSELGVQKATDPELKRFSQQMIDEHTRMNNELWTLASQKRISLPLKTGVITVTSGKCVPPL